MATITVYFLDAMSWMCQFQVLVEVSNILNEAHAGKYLWLAVSIHQSIPGVTLTLTLHAIVEGIAAHF